MIVKKAYAKINLALEVKNKIDGYHKVNNVMIPIDLYDEIVLKKSKEDIITCTADIEDNICKKALSLFKEYFGIEEGVSIFIIKRIPIMAGLAGGSTDAAATLIGLCELFEIEVSKRELLDLAKNLGSDVPFFITNQLALCTNRGEEITPLPITYKPIDIILIKPNVGLSTKDVYSNYEWDKTDKTEKINNVVSALEQGDIELLKENIFNDLEKPALKLSEELYDLYMNLDELGLKPFISGSGPTIYLINPSDEDIVLINALLQPEDFILKTKTL